MNNIKKEIIFISHDASRTGAPILLLNFLRWFKKNTDIPFRIILRKGGELESDFSELVPTLVFEQKLKNRIYDRIIRRLIPHDPALRLKKWLGDFNIGLIYSNTATNGNLLELLSFLDCPVISHIHELEYVIQYFGLESFRKTQKHTTHYIACAEAVKDNLITNHKIPSIDITVIHEFIPIISTEFNSRDKPKKILYGELKLQNNVFIVGASGTTDWRKGVDLFIQLAYTVKRKDKDAEIQFVWVGGQCEGIQHFALEQDILKAGLTNIVHFIGSKPNPLDYFSGFSLFALMSREDPYPLVCLEAASLGKPIICFDQGGGEPEFVEDDCGFVVPYLNLDAMADKILELYQDQHLCLQLGQNAAKKVGDRHDIEITAPEILEVIKQYLILK